MNFSKNICNDQSFFYQLIVDKDGIRNVKLIPVIIENMQVNFAHGTEKEKILQRMQKLSAEFETMVSENGIIQITS